MVAGVLLDGDDQPPLIDIPDIWQETGLCHASCLPKRRVSSCQHTSSLLQDVHNRVLYVTLRAWSFLYPLPYVCTFSLEISIVHMVQGNIPQTLVLSSTHSRVLR